MDYLALLLGLSFLGVTEPIELGLYRNTNYYVVLETDYVNEPIDTSVLDIRGNELARVSRKFKAAMDIEGTGKLTDGRVLNYSARINGQIRYRLSPYEWGLGVGDCELIPFHTIAIDPKKVPLGSIVQIRETIGMELPDGTFHDGYWKAEDIGGAIQKDRVDLFIGVRTNDRFLTKAGIKHLQPLKITLTTQPNESSCVHHLFEE